MIRSGSPFHPEDTMPIPATTAQRLLAACRDRTPMVLFAPPPNKGVPMGVFPLWASEGGRHVVAVSWAASGDCATYRLNHLDPSAWDVREVGAPVPPIDFEAGPVDLTREGPRAVIEALALLERFGLEAELGYRKPNEAPRPRRVRRVVCRDNRVVCEDTGATDARSFLYERTGWVLLPPEQVAPRWNGAEYVAGGAR